MLKQPLKPVKNSVWFTRNRMFSLVSFASKWVGSSPERALSSRSSPGARLENPKVGVQGPAGQEFNCFNKRKITRSETVLWTLAHRVGPELARSSPGARVELAGPRVELALWSRSSPGARPELAGPRPFKPKLARTSPKVCIWVSRWTRKLEISL